MERIADGKILSWATEIDQTTIDQATALTTLPFIHPHLALMPDAHAGKGSSVGTVIPTKGAVIPAAVGVDIGCGMVAVRTDCDYSEIEDLDLAYLRGAIEGAIPLSPGNYNKNLDRESALNRIRILEEGAEVDNVDLSHSPKWREQLGSLGGGNHFLELCLDEHDVVWLFLHSGSRGVGNKIAQRHIKIAQEQCRTHHIQLVDRDHAYLSEGTSEFSQYLADLQWAQLFAKMNRDEMMDRFVEVFKDWSGVDFTEHQRINTHHNYTEPIQIGRESVYLTRKGAIDATEGTWGLIPGSMGTGSYVVVGKGNPAALYSAPHGAGRRFSRTEARKRFTAEDLADRMVGIEYRPGEEWVDEIPDAYKPITEVMRASEDLVEVRYSLRQIMNVKGT
ncbi:RtcB family protein [Nocardia sp. NPDC055002]